MKTGFIVLPLTLVALVCAGCTHVAKSRAKMDARLAEHSRAFSTAVVDALQLQPTGQRDVFTQTALELAVEDQRIEGLPVEPIAVGDLIGASATNLWAANLTAAGARTVAARQESAREDVARRQEEARGLMAKARRAEDRLMGFGERFEAERNARRATWFKRGSVFMLVIGGLVALVVFCPAAIPVLGRVLAWGVGRFPALAGSMGVVSVKAFDAVVKAIEQTRSAASGLERFGNQAGADSAETSNSGLLLNLSREMDAAHKALVRKRKSALNLDR